MTQTENYSPFFSVITPTFNRVHTLKDVYESLCDQTERDFEWVVVDDGSTDETAQLVDGLAAASSFPIHYIFQEHGHKKVALNRGFRAANGFMGVMLDSDDKLLPGGLEAFRDAWETIDENERHIFCGIRALCVDETGRVVGDEFPTSPFDASVVELLYKHRIGGEKISCELLDILKAFPLPEHVQGYVPEHVLWSQISKRYKHRCINQAVRIYADSPDSVSRRLTSADFGPDCEGLLYSSSHVLDCDRGQFLINPLILIKAAANRERFFCHYRKRGGSRKFPVRTYGGKALAVGFGWIGRLLYLRDRMRKSAA